MLEKLKIRKHLILAILLVGLITGISFAITGGQGVFTSVTVPDPIKIGYSAAIQYQISENSSISINVYAEDGTHIRTLLNNVSKMAGTQSITWDTKDSSGVLVPDGKYRVYFEAKDTSGNIVGQAEQLITAARLPAVTNLNDTPDPFNPLNNEQAALSYTISSDSLVTVTIIKGVTPVRTIITNQLQTLGTYTINWDGKDDAGNIAGDAQYYYQVEAVSPLVPTYKSTVKSTVTLEKEAPRITGVSVTPNPLKIGVNTLSMSYTLSENSKVTMKILDSQGNLVQTVLNAVAKNSGFNSASWNGRDSLGNLVPEGTYSAVISAIDNFDKPSGEQTFNFVAGYQPALSNVSITPDIFNPTSGPATINYTTSKDALVTVTILKGTTLVRTITANELKPMGSYTIQWDGKDEAGNYVGDASYYYQVEAVSPTVAAFKSTSKATVIVEKDVPQISAFSVTPDPMKLTTNSLSISYVLSENAKVTAKVLDNSGNLVQTVLDGVSKNAGTNTASWNGKDSLGNYVPEGIYTVVISAVDNYNNPSGELQKTVTAGYLPAISGVSVINNPLNNVNNESAQVNYTISRDALVTVAIYKSSTLVRTITSNELKLAGNYTIAWDGKDDSANLVGDANYTYQIDAVSPTVPTFKSTSKGTVTVEARDPALTELSIYPAIVKLGYSSTIKYTLSEAATVDIKITDNQGNLVRSFLVVNKTAAGAYTLSWDSKDNNGTNVPTGEYIVKITATDAFNKITAAQFNFSAGEVPVIMNVYTDPDTADTTNNVPAKIFYRVSERSFVTVKIYDANNRLWNTLASFKEVTGSDSIAWDGSDINGQKVAGTYTFKIDANSVLGNFKAQQATGTVKVTTTPVIQPPKCTDCHKTYPVEHPVQNCYSCHSGPIEDCTVCHTTPGHTNGSILQNYSCTYCHNDTYANKLPMHPADNDAYHTKPFNMQACSQCHQTSITKEHANVPIPNGQNECDLCHASIDPKVQKAVADKNLNCSGCHVIHTVAGVNHTNPAYTTLPKDSDMDCSLCHVNDTSTEHTNKKDANGVNYTCDTCHGSENPKVKSAIAEKNKNCEACHVDPVTNEPKVHVSANSPIHDSNYITNPDLDCSQCHASNNKVEHMEAKVRYTSDGQLINCATCHKSTNPAVIAAIKNKNNQCTACHTYPTTKHQANHTAAVFTGDINRTDLTTCSLCHTKSLSTEHLNKQTKTGVTMDCNTCHGASAAANVKTAVETKNSNCEACHTIHAPKSAVNEHTSITPYVGQEDVSCLDCHQRNAKTEHMDNSARTTVDGQAITCDTCHGSTNPTIKTAITNKDDKCSTCHLYPTTKHQPTHQTNIYTNDAARSDADSCVICHPSTNLEVSHVGVTDSKTNQPMTCNTCHANGNLLVKEAIRTKQTNSCEACHLIHGPKSTKEIHETADAFATTMDTDCAACHARNVEVEHIEKDLTVGGVSMTCDSCHSSTDPKVVNAIKIKNTKCDACHNSQPTKHSPVHTASVLNSDTTRTDQTTCSICHTKSLTTEHLNKQSKSGATMDCNTCHSSTAADKVKTAITAKNDNCEACHTTHAPQAAVTQHASSNAFVNGEDVSCINCHSRNNKTEHMDNSARTTSTGQPITCDTCHGSTDPKVQTAITTKNDKCSACHTYPTTKHQPIHTTNIYTNDVARTDANQCSICHRTTNLVDSHVGIVNSVTQVAMTCNTCHANTTPAVVTAIATKQTNSCEACHIIHDPKSSAAVHDTADVFQAGMVTDCATCHARNVETEHISKGRTINGVPMTCDSCHSSTDPKVVNAIATNNTRCDACHNAQPTKHNPVHTATVLNTDTTRTDQNTCTICHSKSLTTEHMNKTTSTGAVMDCKTCHSSTAADKVKTAITAKNDNCEACHITHAPKAAITQHNSSKPYVTGEDVSCTNCHARNIRTEHMDNSARTTSTGQPITCDTCHGSSDNKVTTAITNKDDSCSACHTYPTTKHQPLHKTNVYTTDTTRTDLASCNICHTSTNIETLHVGVVDSKTQQAMTCNTCHASTTPAVVAAIATKQTNGCEACHLIHAPKNLAAIHDTNDVFAATMETDCASCHNRNVATEHVDKITSGGVTMTCQTCHESTKPEVMAAINSNNMRCDACHTLPTAKHNPTHTASSLTSDTTRTDLTTCAVCHTKSLTTEHVDKVTKAGVTMNCNTCHSSTASAQVKTAVASQNDDCEACHTVHAPQPAVSQHDSSKPYVVSEDVSCSNCHTRNIKNEHLDKATSTTASGQPITCDTCHGSSDTNVLTAITNKDDSCSACHTYPTTKHQPIHKTNVYTSDTTRSDANSCSICHPTTNIETLHVGVVDSKTNQPMTCNTCHASNNLLVVNAIATKQTNSCEACHLVHAPKAGIHETTDDFAATMDTDCASCHARNVENEHVNKVTSTGTTMTCQTCHESSKPEVINAISTNNTRCDACHTVPTAKHNPVHTATTLTSDTARTDLATCTICHTKSLTTEHVDKVTQAGVTMTCNTCHSSTASAQIKTAVSTKNDNCEACHTVHTPKAAVSQHESVKPYVAAEDISCTNCHVRNIKTEHLDNPARTTASGQPITCDSCHGSTDANIQAAISNKDDQCSACHTYPTTKHNPTHTAATLTSDATRTDLGTCNICHTKSLTTEHVDKVTKAGVTMTCNTCHSSTASTQVKTAVSTNNDNCEACHVVHVPQTALAEHDSTSVYVNNEDVNCTKCHSRNNRTEHMDNPARTTSTGQPITCDTCHNSVDVKVKLAITNKDDKCSACHNYPTTKHQPIHLTNIYTTDTTRTDDCNSCHVKNLATEHIDKTKTAGGVMDCNTCHNSTDPQVITAIETKQTNSCDACHNLHPVKDINPVHDSSNFTDKTYTEPDMNCSNCHSSVITTEHINKTTEAGITMNCDTCHKSSRTDVQTAITNNITKCEACHTKVHTSANPSHATTFVVNKTMACEKCHNANSIADDHSQFKTTGALGTTAGQIITCATCHNSTNTTVVNAIRTSNTKCDACHSTWHSDVQGPHKTAYIPGTGNCMTCHLATTIRYNLTQAYHRVSGLTPTVNTLHGGIFVSPWTTTSDVECRGCHGPNPTNGNYYGKLLKGIYDTNSGRVGYSNSDQLCFICHEKTNYAAGYTGATNGTGFKTSTGRSLHTNGRHTNRGCQACHSLKPHSSSRVHFIALRTDSGETATQMNTYSHQTSYQKSNCTNTCH